MMIVIRQMNQEKELLALAVTLASPQCFPGLLAAASPWAGPPGVGCAHSSFQ